MWLYNYQHIIYVFYCIFIKKYERNLLSDFNKNLQDIIPRTSAHFNKYVSQLDAIQSYYFILNSLIIDYSSYYVCVWNDVFSLVINDRDNLLLMQSKDRDYPLYPNLVVGHHIMCFSSQRFARTSLVWRKLIDN